MAIHCTSDLHFPLHGVYLQLILIVQIDGIITLPVALYGFMLFPDTPATTTAPYLSTAERELAVARMPPVEKVKVMELSFVKRILTTWYFYAFGILWILGNCSEAASSQALLNLYMKSHPTITFSVYQLNNYPTGVQAVGIVSTLIWACSTDIFGKRWISGYYNALTGIIASAIILAPSTSTMGIFGAYYWAGSIYCCQATFFAWANDVTRTQPPAVRAVVIAAMNCGGNTSQAFWPLIFYRADMAPMFTVSSSIVESPPNAGTHRNAPFANRSSQRGMWCMIGVCIMLAIWVTVMVVVEKRLKQGPALDGVAVAEPTVRDSSNEEGIIHQGFTAIDKKVSH